MSAARILVAGVGNIFLGDDGFGVEVVQRLSRRKLPPEIQVIDFGIRGIDLTYALLEDYRQVIIVDAVQRGGKPGTLYAIEPGSEAVAGFQTHEMAPAKVLAAAKAMGAALDNVIIVGCEAESFGSEDDPQMGLSPEVQKAVDEAVLMVENLAAKGLETVHA
jgi:hydrogenase maturation protease